MEHIGVPHFTLQDLCRKKPEHRPPHPLQASTLVSREQEWLEQVSRLYGTALATQLKYERSILAQPERLPGLKSSFLSLESHMGRLHKVDLQDVYGAEEVRQWRPRVSAHEVYLASFEQ